MNSKVKEIFSKEAAIDSFREIPIGKVIIKDWVRDACNECDKKGKSWSCPPGVGDLKEARERLSGYKRAVFVRFKTSGKRKGNEKAVLDIEKNLKEAGYVRAFGFFSSPCTRCAECTFPEECAKPNCCRPTGEAWGIDLLVTSQNAGLEVQLVRAGEDFKPVTLFLLE